MTLLLFFKTLFLIVLVFLTHRFMLLKIVDLQFLAYIAIPVIGMIIIAMGGKFYKDYVKVHIFIVIGLMASALTLDFTLVALYFISAVSLLLLQTKNTEDYDIFFSALSVFAIFFSIASWILFVLMINYDGNASHCNFFYEEPVNTENLSLYNILGLCHYQERDYFGWTLYRMRSFASEPARFMGYILLPIALGMFQRKYSGLRRFCRYYFPVAALSSLSTNVIIVSVVYLLFVLLRPRVEILAKMLLWWLPLASITLFIVFGSEFLSDLLRQSKFNDIQLFWGSTTRRFDYFLTAIYELRNAFPFGSDLRYGGSLPITLILNFGILGVILYVLLVKDFRRIVSCFREYPFAIYALLSIMFPIVSINTSGHFLAPSFLIMFYLLVARSKIS